MSGSPMDTGRLHGGQPGMNAPFSVTELLNPGIDHGYKKTDPGHLMDVGGLPPPPLVPAAYRSQHGGPPQGPHQPQVTTMTSMGGGMAPYNHPMATPLSHSAPSSFPSQYYNGTTDLSHYAADPMGVRSSTAPCWYGTNPDPRIACKYYNHYTLILYQHFTQNIKVLNKEFKTYYSVNIISGY